MVWNPLKGYNPLKDYARAGGWLGPDSVSWSVLNDPIKAAGNAYERLTKGMNPLRPYRTYAAETTQPVNDTAEQGPEYGPFQSDLMPTQAATVAGGTGGTGAQANIDVIDGVAYDLNDPGQFQAYMQAANAKLDSAFDYFKTSTETAKEEDIAEAKAQEERVLQNIAKAMENLSYSRESYDKDYTRSLEDLAEGFRQGTARRQTFYASVAPRVYQSSQGTSQAYGENKYKEGQTRYAEDKARTYRDFNQAEQEYKQSQQDTSNQFNLYKQRRERQAQDAIFNQAQQTQGQRDAMMGKTKNWKADQVSAGRSQWSNVPEFQARDLSGYTPSNVGLNDLMQFIKFQPAGVGMGATPQRSQVMATPEAGGQAHANYLGYQPEQEEEQPLNLYKAGKGSF
jgi:hypothetical protein